MKTWTNYTQSVYSSLAELSAYNETYGIAQRCGFMTARELWNANPEIGGSVNPADFGRVMDAERFIAGYTACALWSSTETHKGADINLDEYAGELADTAVAQMRADCLAFIEANAADLSASGLDAARSGHNYWLNRNGHGSGFWDEYSGDDFRREACNRLSDACKTDGEANLYIGDDGQIYHV